MHSGPLLPQMDAGGRQTLNGDRPEYRPAGDGLWVCRPHSPFRLVRRIPFQLLAKRYGPNMKVGR